MNTVCFSQKLWLVTQKTASFWSSCLGSYNNDHQRTIFGGFFFFVVFSLESHVRFCGRVKYLNRKRGLKGKGGRFYANLWSARPFCGNLIKLKNKNIWITEVSWSIKCSHDGNTLRRNLKQKRPRKLWGVFLYFRGVRTWCFCKYKHLKTRYRDIKKSSCKELSRSGGYKDKGQTSLLTFFAF